MIAMSFSCLPINSFRVGQQEKRCPTRHLASAGGSIDGHPPDQRKYKSLKDYKWPDPTPLDTAPYKPELGPVIDFPPVRESKDHTSDANGYGPGDRGTYQDVLTELSLGEELRLLKANNIDMQKQDDTGLAAMRGYTLGTTLEPATRYGLRIAKVSCRPDDANRQDTQSLTYSEITSSIQRQTVTSSSNSIGVPLVFKFDTSFSSAVATAENSTSVRIYFQASQVIPKARVNIAEEDISLAPSVVEKIRRAVDRKDAVELLDVLQDNGHFVPTSLVLGGRITLHTSTELTDASTFAATKSKLGAAADARFEVEGFPVEVGGGAGHGSAEKAERSVSEQSRKLQMELKGGIESLGSSKAGTLGTKWIDSVGPFLRWRTIGFAPKSLVPITQFLPEDLKKATLDLLRAYFKSKLCLARTGLAGAEGDDHYGPDDETLRRVQRITEIVVNYGENIDGIKWTHALYPQPGKPSTGLVDEIGRWRGEDTRKISLDPDEVVTKIEAGIDPDGNTMRRLAIRTNKNRYPDAKGYYGRAGSARDFKIIEAPRVLGFYGFKATLVHGMGLSYLRLSDDTHSREFLEQIESLLFPNRDYGAV